MFVNHSVIVLYIALCNTFLMPMNLHFLSYLLIATWFTSLQDHCPGVFGTESRGCRKSMGDSVSMHVLMLACTVVILLVLLYFICMDNSH